MKKINILALLLLFSAAAVRAQDDIPADTEVKKTDSGLEYCVLEAGDGKASPKFGDTVKAHYTGWLASDGKKFDSSYDRGETPLEFRLGNVIEGWNEGLTLMSKGAKFKLKIPSALGYGERGTGGIPPGSDLVFVVQLVDFSEGPELPTKPDFSSGTTSELDGGLKHQVVKAGEGDSRRRQRHHRTRLWLLEQRERTDDRRQRSRGQPDQAAQERLDVPLLHSPLRAGPAEGLDAYLRGSAGDALRQDRPRIALPRRTRRRSGPSR